MAEYVEGHELAEMIVRINEKYAEMLEKDIRFSKHIEGEHLCIPRVYSSINF